MRSVVSPWKWQGESSGFKGLLIEKEGIDMKGLWCSRFFSGLMAVAVLFVLSSGCSSLGGGSAVSADTPDTEAATEGDTPGPLYYDFGDVLVPLELKVDKSKSFVYHAPGFTAGVLSLTGRVDVSSLIRFFENNMAKDNWKLVSAFKSPRTIMFFNKTNRSCIINLTEGNFKSQVEIWVAPTVEEGETTLLR